MRAQILKKIISDNYYACAGFCHCVLADTTQRQDALSAEAVYVGFGNTSHPACGVEEVTPGRSSVGEHLDAVSASLSASPC